MRASTSVLPPAPNGTMTVTGRVGQLSCAASVDDNIATAAASAARIMALIGMQFLPLSAVVREVRRFQSPYARAGGGRELVSEHARERACVGTVLWPLDTKLDARRVPQKFFRCCLSEAKGISRGPDTRAPCAQACGYIPAMPALEHCSSWSPVTPLTPTAPVTLPSAMMGNPPGEAKTPGRVATAGPPLLITSAKARVGRR